MYLILGCNELSYEVAERLRRGGAEVVLVGPDTTGLSELRELTVKVGDPRDPSVLQGAGIERAKVVFISSLDFDETLGILEAVEQARRDLKTEPVILALVPDLFLEREVKKLGATGVVPVSQTLGEAVFKELERSRERASEASLRRLVKEARGRMLILTHTNPDPDAIASSVALKTYAKSFGLDADIAYDGEMGYPQNRAMCNLLGVELLRAEEINFRNYTLFALVDVASRAYCALPKEIVPTIVIDHHSVPPSEVSGRFVEIALVGATSTILANYLEYAGIPADPALASALTLGILTDTSNLSHATPTDLEVYWKLRKLSDPQRLRVIQQPPRSQKLLPALVSAIRRRKMIGSCLLADVGEVEEEDTVSQVADFLQDTEGVSTVIAYAVLGDKVRVSGRTKDSSLHLGKIFAEAFGKFGGGHQNMAGAKISFEGKPSKAQINSQIRKLLQALGLKPRRGRVPKAGSPRSAA